MVSKSVFGPAFSSGFRHKYTMHTRLWGFWKLFECLAPIEQVALRGLSRTNTLIRDNILIDHMNSVIHYEYSEYNKESWRYDKCLHKWS